MVVLKELDAAEWLVRLAVTVDAILCNIQCI